MSPGGASYHHATRERRIAAKTSALKPRAGGKGGALVEHRLRNRKTNASKKKTSKSGKENTNLASKSAADAAPRRSKGSKRSRSATENVRSREELALRMREKRRLNDNEEESNDGDLDLRPSTSFFFSSRSLFPFLPPSRPTPRQQLQRLER
jgi:hypothetical protein